MKAGHDAENDRDALEEGDYYTEASLEVQAEEPEAESEVVVATCQTSVLAMQLQLESCEM